MTRPWSHVRPCLAVLRDGGVVLTGRLKVASRHRLASGLAVGVILSLAGCGSGSGAVEVTAPSPTGKAKDQCAALIEDLPVTVLGEKARDVTPADRSAAAWGDPPIVLRCGVQRPSALVATSACFEVNGVGWLATQNGREVAGDEPVKGTMTFTTIGRAAYVEVSVPDVEGHSAADPLTAFAHPIQHTIPLEHPCQ